MRVALAGDVPAAWAGLPPSLAFHERTGAGASLEVNGLISGATEEPRTIIPAVARANLSLRTAPGQASAELARVLERLLREAAPPYGHVDIWTHSAEPALFDPESPPLRAFACSLRQRATRRAVAHRPSKLLQYRLLLWLRATARRRSRHLPEQ